MTKVKIQSTGSARADEAISRHAQSLYATPGKRVIGVVELRHVERTQVAPDEDKEPSVTLRLDALEIAATDQEEVLREALRALYLGRTAQGTLDDEGEVELSKRTLEMTGDRLLDLDVARLTVACRHWAGVARGVINRPKLTLNEARHELEAVAVGLLEAIGIKAEE